MLMLLGLYSPVASTGLGLAVTRHGLVMASLSLGALGLWGAIPWACRVPGVGRTVRLMFHRGGRVAFSCSSSTVSSRYQVYYMHRIICFLIVGTERIW